MTLRVGFVGMGRMGLAHYAILNTHPEVTPVALCDQSKQVLRILARKGEVATFTDVDRMLAEAPLDCLVISTPSDSHAELIAKALERGLHVFVEKPFCLLPDDGKRVLGLLDGKGLVNQVGYVNRFNDVFLEVKRLLDGKVIGPIDHFKFEMYGRTVTRDQTGGWRAEHAKGGGCMYEFASHCIDLVNYLVGPPERVTGTLLHSIVSEKVEDVVSSSLLYEGGCCGTVLVNWCDPTFRKPSNKVELLGERAKIVADKYSYRVYLEEERADLGMVKGWNTRYVTDIAQGVRFYLRGNEFSRQLDHFVDCIQGRAERNICSFRDGHETDRVIHEMFEDARGGVR